MSATQKDAWRIAPHIHNPRVRRGNRNARRPFDSRGPSVSALGETL